MSEAGEAGRLVARHQPWARSFRLSLWAAATLAMATLCYLGLVLASLPITVTGGLLAVGAGWGLVSCIRRFRLDEDVVTIDEAGYRDSRIGSVIPWADIISIHPHQPGTQVSLFIEADDMGRFVSAPRSRRRRLFSQHPETGRPVLVSRLSGLSESPAAVIAAAEKHLERGRGARAAAA